MKDIFKKSGHPKHWARRFFFGLIVIVILLAVFVGGYSTGKKGVVLPFNIGPTSVINTEVGKPANVDFSIFWQAWNKLNAEYVGKLDPQTLMYGAIKGMFEATGDPYTVFMKPDENKQFTEDIAGQFEGIGVEIILANNVPTVVAPLADTPAEKAGIKSKDVILSVDGKLATDLGFEGTINAIRGTAGTEVTLKIQRPGVNDPLEIKVTRAKITVASVESKEITVNGKKYFYIKVRQFGDDTNDLFDKAATDAKNSNAVGIILDLRNNPGGYLDSAVNLSSYFLDGGVVVSEVEKSGAKQDFNTSRSATLKDKKLVVIVNNGSASASEIVAGALKDRNRAKIIGETTYGKGSVQVLENLSDQSAVKITIAKWLTPNGQNIDGKGIAPDVSATEDTTGNTDQPLLKAEELLN